MGEQVPTRLACRVKVCRAKNDVSSNGVSNSVHRSGGFHRLRAGVHAHLAEIVAKTRLHESASLRIQWIPWRTQYLLHDRRCDVRSSCAIGFPLQTCLLLLTLLTLSSYRMLATGACALQHSARRRRQDRCRCLLRDCDGALAHFAFPIAP